MRHNFTATFMLAFTELNQIYLSSIMRRAIRTPKDIL